MKHWKYSIPMGILCAAVSGAATANAQESHEIYKLLPQTSLVGLFDPNMQNRSDIEKALPEAPVSMAIS